MLRTLHPTRDHALGLRLAGIAFFFLLIGLSARVEIWFGSPVPFTLQVLAVLLAGMVLGARDGLAAVLGVLGLIALGMPLDAAGLGPAAFAGPTAGYLIGFAPAAFVAGWLVERAEGRLWQRWLAGVVGIAVIYSFGLLMLKAFTDGTWSQVWEWGAMPFLGLDLVKALIAALLVEGLRAFLRRTEAQQ